MTWSALALVRRWIERSLVRRMTAFAVALTVASVVSLGVGTYVLSRAFLRGAIEARIDSEDRLAAASLQGALGEVVGTTQRFAGSALLGSALVDSSGREQYAGPFLASFAPALPSTIRVALCDHHGHPVAVGMPGQVPSIASERWVGAVLGEGRAWAELHRDGGRSHAFLAWPVLFSGSGTVEGALVVEVDLGLLLPTLPPPHLAGAVRFLADAAGAVLAGHPAPDGIRSARTLPLPEPLGALGMQLVTSVPATALDLPVRRLALGFALVGALLLVAAVLVARALALRLTAPLRTLHGAVTALGDARALPPESLPRGDDEVGQLARAFDGLLVRLRRASEASEARHQEERRAAHRDLRMAQLAVEQATDAVIVAWRDGTVRFANPAAGRLARAGVLALEGRRIGEALEGYTEELWALEVGRLDAEAHLVHERRVVDAAGAVAWIETSVGAVDVEGHPHYVLIVRNVTARKRAENALRLAEVGTLAAAAVHEVKNPLAVIASNASYVTETLRRVRGLLADRASAEVTRALDEATLAAGEAGEAALRIGEVIDGIKLFARRRDDRRAPVDLREAIDAALRLAGSELRHRARVERRISEDAPRVVGNQPRLEQVLVNLLVNAAQAVRPGAAYRNVVSVALRPAGPGEVAVEVADSGEGMTAEVRARIFEPFFTTKPPGAGTGLGLHVSREIARDHGGRIEVESEPGGGSTFRLILPAAEDGALDASGLPRASEVELAARGAPGRVLVVDDDPGVARAIRRVLAAHVVVTVESGREALELLRRGERFDVVLSDLVMPGMSGAELHAHVARDAPGIERTFVFVTGGALTPGDRSFLEESEVAWIEKPFDSETLRAIVSQRVAARRSRG